MEKLIDTSEIQINAHESVYQSVAQLKAYLGGLEKQVSWLREKVDNIPPQLASKILLLRVVESDRNPALVEMFWMRACKEGGVEFVPVSDGSQNMAYAMSYDDAETANKVVHEWNKLNPTKKIVAMTFLQLALTRANVLEKLIDVTKEFISKNT